MLKFILASMKSKNKNLDRKSQIIIILLMLPAVFTILFMGKVMEQYGEKGNIRVLMLAVFVCIISIIAFYLTERQMKLKEYELEIRELENQYQLQVQNYENLREQTRAATEPLTHF